MTQKAKKWDRIQVLLPTPLGPKIKKLRDFRGLKSLSTTLKISAIFSVLSKNYLLIVNDY